MISSEALNRRLARGSHAHDEQWWQHGLRSPRDLSLLAASRMLPPEPTYGDFFLSPARHTVALTELN